MKLTIVNNRPNYLKLCVVAPLSLQDGEAVSLPPSQQNTKADSFVTTWTWTFSTKCEAEQALKLAQAKRGLLRSVYNLNADAFQLSTFRTSTLRGVPVLGKLESAADALDDLEAAS